MPPVGGTEAPPVIRSCDPVSQAQTIVVSHAVSTPSHEFLSDSSSHCSTKNRVSHEHIQGHRQLTDIYLHVVRLCRDELLVKLGAAKAEAGDA